MGVESSGIALEDRLRQTREALDTLRRAQTAGEAFGSVTEALSACADWIVVDGVRARGQRGRLREPVHGDRGMSVSVSVSARWV